MVTYQGPKHRRWRLLTRTRWEEKSGARKREKWDLFLKSKETLFGGINQRRPPGAAWMSYTKSHSKGAFRRHGHYLWDCTGWKPVPPFDYTLVLMAGKWSCTVAFFRI
jgi:hypothetical protein